MNAFNRYTDDRILQMKACGCYQPAWMQPSHSAIIEKVFNKIMKIKDGELMLLISFTKKTLDYYKNKWNCLNVKAYCIAIAENEEEKDKIERIWNRDNELFDFVFTYDEYEKWIIRMKKFDKIIMNPPYNGNAGLYAKITAKAAEKSDDVVCLSPYIFYQEENPSKEGKKIIDFLEKRFESIEYVPGNAFDGAAFDKPIGLMHFIKDKKSSLSFKDLFYKKFKDRSLAEKILFKVKTYIKIHNNDTCNLHLIKKEDFDNYQFKIVMTHKRGNADKKTGNPNWDWTTLLEKDRQNNFTLKAKDIKTPNCNAIPFNNVKMCKNFVSYSNSDFFMFLIYAYKTSLSQVSNLKYIPFLDFTRNWTDSDLQKEFSLSSEEMEYIKEEMKPFGWKTKEDKK